MKLDKDLVREILLQVEAYPHPMGWVGLSVSGHSAEEWVRRDSSRLRISPLWTDTTGARSD
jgi:hypothetical protein